MYYKFFNIPMIKSLLKQAKVIPIAGAKENLTLMNKAFETISEEIKEGNAICIFPEGQLTSDGQLAPFRPGVEKILAENPVPVIPVTIEGLWGSIFSRKKEKEKIHRRFVTVTFFPPLQASDVSCQQLEKFYGAKLGAQKTVII